MHFTICILANPLHSHELVGSTFNYFVYCMEICDKLRKDLAMLTYIFHNVDECWLTSSTKVYTPNFVYVIFNSRKCRFWILIVALKVVEMKWYPVTYILANLITNSIHAWLTKDYRSSGMYIVLACYCP